MSELSDILNSRQRDPRGIENVLYKSAIHQRDEQAFKLICTGGTTQYMDSVFSTDVGNALLGTQWDSGFRVWVNLVLQLVDNSTKSHHIDKILGIAKLNSAFLDIFINESCIALESSDNPEIQVNIAKRLSCAAIVANRPDIMDQCFTVFGSHFDFKRELWGHYAHCLEEHPHVWLVDKWLTTTKDPSCFHETWNTWLKYGATSDLSDLLKCGLCHLPDEELHAAYEDLFVSAMHSAQRFSLCDTFNAFAHANNWPSDKRYPPVISRRIAQVATQDIISSSQWQPWVENMIASDRLQLSYYCHIAEKTNQWNVVKYIHAKHPEYFLHRLDSLMKDPDPTWVEAMVGQIGDDVDRVLVRCRHSTPILEALKERIQIADAIAGISPSRSMKKM